MSSSFTTTGLTRQLIPMFGVGTVFSPYSVFSALLPLFEGSDKSSRDCLGSLLGLDPKSTGYFIDFYSLNKSLSSTGELQFGNCMMTKDNFKVYDDYLDQSKSIVERMTFTTPKQLVELTNRYVNEKTKGLISNIVSDEDVDEMTRLLLCNTVYFLAKWRHPFVATTTKLSNFTRHDSTTVELPLMNQTFKRTVSYAETDKLQYVEMEYENPEFAMGVLLPKDPSVLSELNNHATYKWCMESCELDYVNVHFPKFTHRTKQSLKSVLTSLGCGQLFESVNLSRMTDDTRLEVSDVIHEAVVIVDEEKTEAAAVTAVYVLSKCLIREPTYYEFRANRTFIYNIIHRPTQTILFSGCYDGN